MPDYVRAFEAEDYTVKHRSYVYEVRGDGCPNIERLLQDGQEPPEDCDRLICQMVSNVNESELWCPTCGDAGIWTMLHKTFQAMGVSMATVWHDPGVPHMATGAPVSGYKDLKEQLKRKSGEMEDRLGGPIDLVPVDLAERDALGITDEGMDATHDRAVAEGRKDSRGRFVW